MTPTPDDDIHALLNASMTPEPPMAETVTDAVKRGRTLRRRRRAVTAVGAAFGIVLVGGTAYGVANLGVDQDLGVAARTTATATPRPLPEPTATPTSTRGTPDKVVVEPPGVVRPSTTIVCFKGRETGVIDVYPKGTSFSKDSSGGYFVDWPLPKPYSYRTTVLDDHDPVPCPPGSVVSEDKLKPVSPWQELVRERLGDNYVVPRDGNGGLTAWQDGDDLGTVAVDVYHHDDPHSASTKSFFMSNGPDGEPCAITPAKGAGRERFEWTSCESETLDDGSTLKVAENDTSRGVSLFRADGTVVTMAVSKDYFEGTESLETIPVSEETLRDIVTDPRMLER